MTQAERDVAEEDYESRKDDLLVKEQWASGAGAAGVDFERDSEGRRSTEKSEGPPGGGPSSVVRCVRALLGRLETTSMKLPWVLVPTTRIVVPVFGTSTLFQPAW